MSDDPPKVVISCKCGQKMKVPADAKGKVFKCVRCAEPVRMSENAAPAPAAAPSPPPKQTTPHRAEPMARPVEETAGHLRIGELLIGEGLISDEQLEKALAIQKEEGGKTFEILIREKFLDKDALHSFLSKKSGVPAIELKRLRMERELVQLIPREFALEQYVLPIDKLGKLLTVAMACPIDKRTIAEIEQITGLRVKAMLAKLDEIHAAVEKYYPSDDGGEGATFSMGLIPSATTGKKEDVASKVEELVALPAPVTLIERLESLGESGVRDAARMAQMDPAMAATLLSLANSAAYGMTGRVDSVPMAVAVVGWSGIKEACTRCKGAAEINQAESWRRRALRAGKIAEALAGASGRVKPPLAYTGGLLHVLGRLVLATASPQKYKHIESDLACMDLVAEEEKAFTLTHVEAGSKLALGWHLPTGLSESLRCYLDPTSANENAAALTHIVSIAAYLCSSENGLSADLLEPCVDSVMALELDSATVLSQTERALQG